MTKAIVVGGGIGGLTAAIALRRIGFEAVVYERAAELREVGAGLGLWSPTMRILRQLGVADEVLAIGAPMCQSRMATWRGDTLSRVSVNDVFPVTADPSICIHRADLQQVLYRALPPTVVQLNARCVGFIQDDAGVIARFADGRTERGELLIGADGLSSAIREQLLGKSKPSYAGYTCWRGIASLDPTLVSGTLSETWGCGSRFGLGDLGRGRVLWFATANAPEGETETLGERKRQLIERFRGWHAPIEAAIAATPESAILRNDIYDREPVDRWGEDRVTLLGDAAHPTTPNLGMGACQAIEDALVVATCLNQDADIAVALRRYEKSRQARTAMITRLSRQFGRLAQWENPLACAVRNVLLKLTPASVVRNQFRQVVAYETT